MAGKESSGNPSGEQGATSKGGPRGSQDKAHSKKSRAPSASLRTSFARPLQRQKRREIPPLRAGKRRRLSGRDDKRIVGGVKPISPKERRKWERVVEKKKEKRRRRYRAVHGKVVEWVDHWIEDAYLFVRIRFQGQTELRLQFGAKMVTDEIDFCDVNSGTSRLVRQYFRRRDL